MEIRPIKWEEVRELDQKIGNIYQTPEWMQVKKLSWDSELLGVFEGAQILGYFWSQLRSVPLGYKMIYICRGPVLTDPDSFDFRAFAAALKVYGKNRKAMEIKLDPLFIQMYKPYGSDEFKDGGGDVITQKMVDAGFIFKGNTIDIRETAQPRIHAVIYKEDYEKGNAKRRKNSAIAMRRGVYVRAYRDAEAREHVDEFVELLRKTEERKDIHLRNREYFTNLIDSMPGTTICIAYVDLGAEKTKTREQLEACTQEEADVEAEFERQSAACGKMQAKADEKFADHDSDEYKKECRNVERTLVSHQKAREKKLKNIEEKRQTLKNYQEAIEETAQKYGEKELPMCTVLTTVHNNYGELMYAGFDETFRYFKPSCYTWEQGIEDGFARGLDIVSMGGILGTEDDKLWEFKSQFNPVIEHYIGEFDLQIHPVLGKIFNALVTVYRKIR